MEGHSIQPRLCSALVARVFERAAAMGTLGPLLALLRYASITAPRIFNWFATIKPACYCALTRDLVQTAAIPRSLRAANPAPRYCNPPLTLLINSFASWSMLDWLALACVCSGSQQQQRASNGVLALPTEQQQRRGELHNGRCMLLAQLNHGRTLHAHAARCGHSRCPT